MAGAAAPARSLPERVETVLLDAGGVLLDLDYAFVRRVIVSRGAGRELGDDELARFEAIARREIHRHVGEGGSVGAAWRDYFHVILAHSGVAAERQDGVIDALWEAHQRFGLWTVAIPGSREAVAGLKRRGLRLGVVSNAEGQVERDLIAAGYDGLLETIVDSHRVGVEKPDPRIFAIALERLGVEPGTAVFVGDLPAVDVEGARAAGLSPVLLDRHGLYPDLDVPRIGALGELSDLLPGAG